MSSILEQASDRGVGRVIREELITLRGRFRALEGEDPMKSEVTGVWRSQNFDDNRSSTTQILKFLPSYPVDLGTVLERRFEDKVDFRNMTR